MGDQYGELYVGLTKTTQFSSGAKVDQFVPLDPAYMNFKVDVYDQRELISRTDLNTCSSYLDLKDTFE